VERWLIPPSFILEIRGEIHQVLLSKFSILVEFPIGKVQVNDKDGRALTLVNLNSKSQGLSCGGMAELVIAYIVHPRDLGSSLVIYRKYFPFLFVSHLNSNLLVVNS
jgi:hypothetical protein